MTTTADALQPWDRRPAETPKAHAMFTAYKDMGPRRSIRGLAARESVAHLGQLFAWSRQNDWVDRAGSWDDFLTREESIDQLEAAKAMRRRHAELGRTMLDTCIERARLIDVEKLSVRDLVLLTELSVKLERTARGEATAGINLDTDLTIAEGPTGADILAALRDHPELLDFTAELDRIMYDEEKS